MANMKTVMPALQRQSGRAADAGMSFVSVSLPKQQRETRIEKNMAPEEIAREIVRLDQGGITWNPSCSWFIPKPTARWPAGRWRLSLPHSRWAAE